MAYGLSTRMHLLEEPGPSPRQGSNRYTSAAYSAVWNRLREDERLALVERALRKAA